METESKKDTVIKFNIYVNNRDLSAISDMLTEDHLFIDFSNNQIQGKSKAIEAWKKFFREYPDYINHFQNTETQSDTVTVTGYSTCSVKELSGPAIWKVKVKNEKIAEWRVEIVAPETQQELGAIRAKYGKRMGL